MSGETFKIRNPSASIRDSVVVCTILLIPQACERAGTGFFFIPFLFFFFSPDFWLLSGSKEERARVGWRHTKWSFRHMIYTILLSERGEGWGVVCYLKTIIELYMTFDISTRIASSKCTWRWMLPITVAVNRYQYKMYFHFPAVK